MERKRKGLTTGVNIEGVNNIPDVNPQMLHRPNGADYNPEELLSDGRKRYLVLSDGQVFDRANQPKPNRHIPEMIACNESDKVDLSRGRSREKRLALLLRALDRDFTGLTGKENLLDKVRYGLDGSTLREIRDSLT